MNHFLSTGLSFFQKSVLNDPRFHIFFSGIVELADIFDGDPVEQTVFLIQGFDTFGVDFMRKDFGFGEGDYDLFLLFVFFDLHVVDVDTCLDYAVPFGDKIFLGKLKFDFIMKPLPPGSALSSDLSTLSSLPPSLN